MESAKGKVEEVARLIAAIQQELQHQEQCATDWSILATQRRDEIVALKAENAELRELIKPIALVPLWRDRYPDGPDIGLGTNDRPMAVTTPDQIRKARALLARTAPATGDENA